MQLSYCMEQLHDTVGRREPVGLTLALLPVTHRVDTPRCKLQRRTPRDTPVIATVYRSSGGCPNARRCQQRSILVPLQCRAEAQRVDEPRVHRRAGFAGPQCSAVLAANLFDSVVDRLANERRQKPK